MTAEAQAGAIDGDVYRNLPHFFRQSRREIALVGMAALILFGLTGFSFWLGQRAIRDRETASTLNEFTAKVAHLVQTLRTIESSQRGYLITGNEKFLEPYQEMAGLMLAQLATLEAEAPIGLKARQTLLALETPLNAKLREMNQTIEFARAGNRDAAISLVSEGHGRRLTKEIEHGADAIIDEARMLLSGNLQRTDGLERLKFDLDFIGVILILTLSSMSLYLLMRSNAAMKAAQLELADTNASLEDIVDQRTAALTRANEEIQRFAYIVSHDLRSPLVNIMGFTSELEALQKDLFGKLEQANALAGTEDLSKDFGEAIGFIKSSIARMERLIAAILRISREGNRPLAPERIEMTQVVEQLVAALAHQIREKEVDVQVGNLPAIVADRLSIEQVFSNLIENAIKFLQRGKPGTIRIDANRNGPEVVYEISDNGRGIDPRDHRRIFELFRRSGPQDVPGEGMGLAHVTALVRRLGGSIDVESALGQGSTFKVKLPAAMAPKRKLAA